MLDRYTHRRRLYYVVKSSYIQQKTYYIQHKIFFLRIELGRLRLLVVVSIIEIVSFLLLEFVQWTISIKSIYLTNTNWKLSIHSLTLREHLLGFGFGSFLRLP